MRVPLGRASKFLLDISQVLRYFHAAQIANSAGLRSIFSAFIGVFLTSYAIDVVGTVSREDCSSLDGYAC